MSQERKNWHMYFTPCGMAAVEGFVFKRCPVACEEIQALCFVKGAHKMAGYLLNGSTIDIERRDFINDFITRIGATVIDLEGNTMRLSQGNIDSLVDSVVQRAQEIVRAINICIEHTSQLSEDHIDACPPEERETFFGLEELIAEAESFRGSKEQAEQLIGKIRAALERAIDLDLDEFGLITRWAIVYGLGEKVLAKRNIPAGIIPIAPGVLKREK